MLHLCTRRTRTPAGGRHAAETGRWVGRWNNRAEIGGIYLAGWREDGGAWRLERELYVTLRG